MNFLTFTISVVLAAVLLAAFALIRRRKSGTFTTMTVDRQQVQWEDVDRTNPPVQKIQRNLAIIDDNGILFNGLPDHEIMVAFSILTRGGAGINAETVRKFSKPTAGTIHLVRIMTSYEAKEQTQPAEASN